MKRNKLISLSLVLSLVVCLIGVNPEVTYAAYQKEVGAITYNGYKIPAYEGDFYEVVNGNDAKFTAAEKTTKAFEQYSKLDSLGRCGEAYANVCQELMPTEERGSIGSVKPSGWIQAKYDFVDGKYLYNRCHLIGYQLTGENANECNLITGTRSFNVDGMLPFENAVAEHVEETGNHVLYRVTPVFVGNNLLASGVLIEAESVEDSNFEFCVFCYNVEPGVSIDYEDGKSILTEELEKGKEIKECTITLSNTSYTYDGKAKKPTVTIKDGAKKLVKGTDYTIAYSNNILAGTGLVKITGKGKYEGTATRSFKITTKSIKGMTISKVSNKTYTGKQIKPIVTVKNGTKKLVKGTDYTVTYGKNVDTGIGVLTVKGKGSYTGSKQIKFNIVPKKPTVSLVSKTKTTIKIKWTNVKGENGYQLAYKKKGDSSYKTKIIDGNTRKLTDLKKGTSYQIKVRANKKIDGKKEYGNWSKVKTIKTKGTASSGNKTVYITKTGTKFHYDKNCRGLSNANKIYTTTLSDAKADGLTLCGYED